MEKIFAGDRETDGFAGCSETHAPQTGIDAGRAAVIIVNWNGLRFLNDCLKCVLSQTYQNYEVVLVDNGSTDGSGNFVKKNFPVVQIVELGENRGFAAANNIAIRAAIDKKINYICLLNNDTKASPHWLSNLVRTAQADKRIGMVASKMLFMMEPSIIDSTGHIFLSGKIADRGNGQRDSGQYDNQADVIGACAGACLYKRDMLEQIGLFDESFGTYYEDAELSWRAHNKGWQAKYAPGAVVFHYHGGTTKSSRAIEQAMMELSTINIVKTIRRHDSFLGKSRTSYAWLKMAISGSIKKIIKGSGEGGKPYLDRLKRLWL